MAHLPNSNFRRLGLGFGRNRLSLSEILSLVSVSKTDCVLLKIDCEGAEWEGGIEHADLAGIDAFVIEIHGLGNANLASIQRPVIERLWRDFKCLNIHPCNYGGSFPLDGVRVPRVVELSFLSRRIRQDGFNNPLNHPCNPRADELPWINPCVNSP
jgi:hypothetical protein